MIFCEESGLTSTVKTSNCQSWIYSGFKLNSSFKIASDLVKLNSSFAVRSKSLLLIINSFIKFSPGYEITGSSLEIIENWIELANANEESVKKRAIKTEIFFIMNKG